MDTMTTGRPGAAGQGQTGPIPLHDVAAGGAPEWVMIARAGRWRGHPTMGAELITPAHLRSALDYFRRHYAANGTDLVVDYHHASVVAPLAGTQAPAAGWIRGMELRNGGAELWGRVLWTADAANAIGRREFRYLSPVLRFNAPDRVSGEPTPMMVHSVALTNTPFLTELESLNQAAAAGSRISEASQNGDKTVSLLQALASAQDKTAEQVASEFGLAQAAGDADVANAVGALAARVNALREDVKRAEAKLAVAPPVVAASVANALGVATDADEVAVKAAILRLKAPGAGLEAVRAQLGLGAGAAEAEILNAIGALQEGRRRTEAEELVDAAVAEGRMPPAHRAFYLREAVSDPQAAREVINSLPVLTAPQQRPAAGRQGRSLDQGERSVCAQLGISQEAFLNSQER